MKLTDHERTVVRRTRERIARGQRIAVYEAHQQGGLRVMAWQQLPKGDEGEIFRGDGRTFDAKAESMRAEFKRLARDARG